MSLRSFASKEEIRELVRFITEDGGSGIDAPQNQTFFNVTTFILQNMWPESASKMRFFGYPHDRPVYLFIVDENPKLFPFIVVRTPTSGHQLELIREAVPLLLEEIQQTLNETGHFLLDCELAVRDEVLSLLCSGDRPAFSADTDVHNVLTDHLFYMTKEQQKAAMETKVCLPENFEFTQIDHGDETDKIHSIWTYASTTHTDISRQRIQNLPYTAVRATFNGEIVAWELMHCLGMFMHLHCLPEYRERGLGTAVELKMAQTFLEKGLRVVKYVDQENTRVLNGTMRHSLWSVWKRDGVPIDWTFTVINKNEKSQE